MTTDIPYFSEQLFYLTSGYPFLVSLLCKTIHEKILPAKETGNEWQPQDLGKALQISLNGNFAWHQTYHRPRPRPHQNSQ